MSTDSKAKTRFQSLILGMQEGKESQEDFFKSFLTTEFYLGFKQNKANSDEQNFDFLVYKSQQTAGVNTVVISEEANYLQNMGAKDIMLIKGGDLLNSIYPKTEISIAFTGGGIGMTVDMLDWLRGCIKPKEDAESEAQQQAHKEH